MQHFGLQKLRVQFSDSIDRVAPESCQMCHPHITLSSLIDQREPAHPVLVAGIFSADGIEMPSVDLVDYFQMTREQGTKQAQGPLLKRFGQ